MPGRGGDHGPHRYRAACHWSGSTGGGYDAFERSHEGVLPARGVHLRLSADPAFRGDPGRANPEELVVLAASSCQLLSFLAVAAVARLEVVAYDDEAEGLMTEEDPPVRLQKILLRPTIVVAPPASEARVLHLVEVAHRECYVANSIRSEIELQATVVVRPPGTKT